MFGYDKIIFIFSYHWVLLILLISIALVFTVYSYRFTLPPISNFKRIILISLRFLALLLLISIFFEPILSLEKKVSVKPSHLIFIDNSKSISQVKDKESLKKLLENIFSLENNVNGSELKFFTFGKEVNEIKIDNTKINFDERVTNLSKVFNLNEVLKEDYQKINPASITILTDGIITDGINPIYQAEKLGIPVYVFAIGDSSKKKDVIIKNVVYNENVYLGNQSTISTTVTNIGYQNTNVNVSLIEGDKILESQIVTLDAAGVNVVNFNYLPKEKGEKKLQVKVQQLEGEFNKNNNAYPFFLKVSEEKTRILIITGNPNPDFTFIKNVIGNEEIFLINTLTQISADKFLEDNHKAKIDSADILYLIGFPNKFTPEIIWGEIKNKILNKKAPFFLMINNDVDYNKIRQVESALPVKFETFSDTYIKAQPDINFNENFDLLSNIFETDWNKLPPVLYPPNSVSAKTESRVISYIKTENNKMKLPLIVQRSIASSRVICFVGKEFWRWKLQTATENIGLFDNLILNTTKWLSAEDGNQQFKIKTLKKFYSVGEEAEFVAELYDELLNPVNNGIIEVEIKNEVEARKIQLTDLGNGLYEGKINLNKSGDYNFSANVKQNNKTTHSATGKFNIGDVDIETIDLRMNYEFLSDLSKRTNGEVFFLDEFNLYFNTLKELNQRTSSLKTISSQFKLWSNEIFMILAIILFGIEWFIRKQSSLI